MAAFAPTKSSKLFLRTFSGLVMVLVSHKYCNITNCVFASFITVFVCFQNKDTAILPQWIQSYRAL